MASKYKQRIKALMDKGFTRAGAINHLRAEAAGGSGGNASGGGEPPRVREGHVLIEEHGGQAVEMPSTLRCVRRSLELQGVVYLSEQSPNAESTLMVVRDTGTRGEYRGEVVTFGECMVGDIVFGAHWNHPRNEPRAWTPVKILAVGGPSPEVTAFLTLRRALRSRSHWRENLSDLASVKAHLLEAWPLFGTPERRLQLTALEELDRAARAGRDGAVKTTLDRLEAISRNPEKATSRVDIVLQFDPRDPKMQSGTQYGAYVEPIRTVRLLHGDRNVLVWVSPMPAGSAGWNTEFNIEAPEPLFGEERTALEAWFREFAEATWPKRTIIWPPIYRYRRPDA